MRLGGRGLLVARACAATVGALWGRGLLAARACEDCHFDFHTILASICQALASIYLFFVCLHVRGSRLIFSEEVLQGAVLFCGRLAHTHTRAHTHTHTHTHTH